MPTENAFLSQLDQVIWHPRHPQGPAIQLCHADFRCQTCLCQRYDATLSNGQACRLAAFPARGLAGRWRAGAAVRQHYDCLVELEKQGLPVAQPLAWGQGEWGGFLLLEAPVTQEPASRPAMVQTLASLIGRLLAASIDHPDFGWECLDVVSDGADGIALQLDGCHAAPVRNSLPPAGQQALMAPLAALYPELTLHERQALWTKLGKAAKTSPARLRQLAHAGWRQAARAARLPPAIPVAEGDFWLTPAIDLETARAAVQHYRTALAAGQLFKQKGKRGIAKLELAGRHLVVKGYRRFPFRPFSPDARSWHNAFALAAHHVPCVDYLAWFRDGSGACIIMRDLGPNSLDIELARIQDNPRQVSHRLEQLGLLIAQLHELGILFKDLKTSNVHVEPGRDALCLLDLDSVQFGSNLSFAQIQANLQVMYHALPPCVPPARRLRVLTAYAVERGWPRAELRRLRNCLDLAYRG